MSKFFIFFIAFLSKKDDNSIVRKVDIKMDKKPLKDKFKFMRLKTMGEVASEILTKPEYDDITPAQTIEMIVDAEYSYRLTNRNNRLIRRANFVDSNAQIDSIYYSSERELSKSTVLRLASCQFINDKTNLIITGASGAGKTFLATAIGVAACKEGYTTKYIRYPKLIGEINLSKYSHNDDHILAPYKKSKLLIIDEWLLTDIDNTQAAGLLEIIDARQYTGSTIYCTQYKITAWPERLGISPISASIIDRIIHQAEKIDICGNISMRSLKL
jgi:DNA replication protein DnaC